MTVTATATRGDVTLEHLVKRYGDTLAVDDVSLQVRSGEFISLLGPSGCGKTTMLRMLAGFEEPDSGDILLAGTSVVDLAAHKRPVNTVFQAYALFPHMSVAQNVAYGLRQRRTPRSEIGPKVAAALDMVQMRRFADRRPTMLSGGQQQRIALARALVNQPDVLLLDEPMSALDRKLREEMQVELKLLQRRLGITFIFVTHDQQEALSMSDRVVVMLDGKVQQSGDARQVYSRPANAFVAGFIGKQNFLPATVAEAAVGGGTVVLETPDGRLLCSTGADADAALPVRGATVQAAIRPESLTLSIEQPDGPNTLRGRVAGVSFLGDVVQYVIVTGSGRELLVRTPRSHAVALDVEETVHCQVDAEQVQVFGS